MVSEVRKVNIHVYPSTMLNESRIDRMSRSLHATGAFSGTYLVGISGPGLSETEDLGDRRCIRRPAVRIRARGPLGKLLCAAAWQLLVYRAYRRAAVSLVHAHSVWMLPLCWAIARSSGAELVYNAHELETETPTMKGPKRAAAQFIERTLIRECAVVSTVNESIAGWYESNRAIPRPHSLRNIPLVNRVPVSLRAQLDIPVDTLLFIHTGRLTGGRHIEQILETFREQSRAHVVFLGAGPLYGLVRAAADESPVVHWLPPVAPDLVVSYVSEADVALCLIELDSLSYRLSSPNKLFEGLAVGVPVLCTDLAEARVLLGDHADEWILGNVPRDLSAAIRRIDASNARYFKDTWGGLCTWDEEAASYVAACVEAMGHVGGPQTVWIMNHYAARPEEGAGSRHFFLGRGLMAHGWRTTIIGGSNHHYSGTQRLSWWQLQTTESLDGVTFRWLRTISYRGNGLRRIVSMVGFALGSLNPLATRRLARPDAVIGSSVHPLAAWAGSVLSRRHRVPFYFEIRDLWPETLIQLGALKRGGSPARAMRRLEVTLCARATRVITTMPYAYEYLTAQGVARDKIDWISNGVERRQIDYSYRDTNRRRDASEDLFTFTYFGAFGSANALDVLVKGFDLAFRDDAFEGARLRLVGDGPERQALAHLIDAAGLTTRVTVADPVPKSEIPLLAASSDVLVVALLPLDLYEFGISLNKLFDYMAAGRPILFAGRARGNPVDDQEGGLVTDCDAKSVAEAMRILRHLPGTIRRDMGAHNLASVEARFTFDVLSSQLAATLSSDSQS